MVTRPQQLNEGHALSTLTFTNRHTPDRQTDRPCPAQRSELRLGETHEEEIRSPPIHGDLSSPGAYYCPLLLHCPTSSRTEQRSSVRNEAECLRGGWSVNGPIFWPAQRVAEDGERTGHSPSSKTPQEGRHKQQRLVFLWSWRPESQTRG